jgi:hypothetical protein
MVVRSAFGFAGLVALALAIFAPGVASAADPVVRPVYERPTRPVSFISEARIGGSVPRLLEP